MTHLRTWPLFPTGCAKHLISPSLHRDLCYRLERQPGECQASRSSGDFLGNGNLAGAIPTCIPPFSTCKSRTVPAGLFFLSETHSGIAGRLRLKPLRCNNGDLRTPTNPARLDLM